MKLRNESENGTGKNISRAELLQAMKGIYTAAIIEDTKGLRIGLPAPAPAFADKTFHLPQAMAKLIDAYIEYTIELNGHEPNENSKKTYSGHIATELFRLSIAGDKAFEKYLQQKSNEQTKAGETINSKSGGSKESDLESSSQEKSSSETIETTAVAA